MADLAIHPATVLSRPSAEPASAAFTREIGSRGRISFALFILVNAVLMLRPSEIFASLTGLPIYEIVIIACLLASLPAVLWQLRTAVLFARPITAIMLGLLVVVPLSHLSHFDALAAGNALLEFGKIVLYFLLLIAVVNTPQRVRIFLIALLVLITAMAVLPLLEHHGVVRNSALATLLDRDIDSQTGRAIAVPRLRGPGIFHDPNDLCHVLSVGVLISLYCAATAAGLWRKLLCGATLGVLGYAIILTQSRGGLLALLAGLAVLFVTRFGWRKALILGPTVFAGVLMLSSGRQTDISTVSETGQERIQLWSDALVTFRTYPLLGIGQGNFPAKVTGGMVSHNSFLECYADLGFVGGTLFLSAFYLPVSGMFRRQSAPSNGARGIAVEASLARLRPYLTAIVACYVVGMLSLTRSYAVPTYMILGLAAAYMSLAPVAGMAPPRLSLRLAARLVALGMFFVLAMQVFVRVAVKW